MTPPFQKCTPPWRAPPRSVDPTAESTRSGCVEEEGTRGRSPSCCSVPDVVRFAPRRLQHRACPSSAPSLPCIMRRRALTPSLQHPDGNARFTPHTDRRMRGPWGGGPPFWTGATSGLAARHHRTRRPPSAHTTSMWAACACDVVAGRRGCAHARTRQAGRRQWHNGRIVAALFAAGRFGLWARGRPAGRCCPGSVCMGRGYDDDGGI